MSRLPKYLTPLGRKDVMLRAQAAKRFYHLSLSAMSNMKSGPLFILKYVADFPHRLLRCFHSATLSYVLCRIAYSCNTLPVPYSERIYLLRCCYTDDEMSIAQSRDKIESILQITAHRTLI